MGRGSRRALGVAAMGTMVVVYIAVAMVIGATLIVEQHAIVQLVYFVVAGLAWTVPCMAIIRWMRRDPA